MTASTTCSAPRDRPPTSCGATCPRPGPGPPADDAACCPSSGARETWRFDGTRFRLIDSTEAPPYGVTG